MIKSMTTTKGYTIYYFQDSPANFDPCIVLVEGGHVVKRSGKHCFSSRSHEKLLDYIGRDIAGENLTAQEFFTSKIEPRS